MDRESQHDMVLVCYLLSREEDIQINSICFHCNFDHPHISAVMFVPRKQSKKPQLFSARIFDMYLLLCLSSRFSQNSLALLKNRYLIVVSLKN